MPAIARNIIAFYLSGVDLTATGTNIVLTISGGRKFVCTGGHVRITAETGASEPFPQLTLGNNTSTYDNLSSGNTIDCGLDERQNLTFSNSIPVMETEVRVNVTTGSGSTTLVGEIVLEGYFV